MRKLLSFHVTSVDGCCKSPAQAFDGPVAGLLGESVRFPPQDSPFDRFTVLRDPQGATFNAIRPRTAPEELVS